ncbi:hypothetical protein [Morganella morganii]|uniref:hypothetical protein n=1 Tax=Morganella morganii TaxID=582 RepID=UPI000B3182C8|nr:hypothetical protein [Morganella morganii]
MFWIITISLTPFILFFIKFNINDLDSIDRFGLFGSYLSGTTSFLLIILTLFSIYILYKTLILTREYNEKQIGFSNTQIKISNFTLLVDLLSERITLTKEKYNESDNTLGLTDYFTSLIASSKENHAYMKDKDESKYAISNYSKSLSLFLENNEIILSDEFILKMMHASKNSNYFRYIANEFSPIIKIIIDIIMSKDTTQDLKDIFLIMLKNKIHNDIILWGVIYSSSDIETIYSYVDTIFTIPNTIGLELKRYMKSDDS